MGIGQSKVSMSSRALSLDKKVGYNDSILS